MPQLKLLVELTIDLFDDEAGPAEITYDVENRLDDLIDKLKDKDGIVARWAIPNPGEIIDEN